VLTPAKVTETEVTETKVTSVKIANRTFWTSLVAAAVIGTATVFSAASPLALAQGVFNSNGPDLSSFQLIDALKSNQSAPGPLVDVNALTFQTQVLEKAGVVLVEFMLPTCAECNPTVRVLKNLVSKYDGKVSHLRLDIDKNPGLGEKYDIPRVPAVLVFKDGQFVEKLAVFNIKQESHLAATINEQLGLPTKPAALATKESSTVK
jgi:thioredoxin 1